MLAVCSKLNRHLIKSGRDGGDSVHRWHVYNNSRDVRVCFIRAETSALIAQISSRVTVSQ